MARKPVNMASEASVLRHQLQVVQKERDEFSTEAERLADKLKETESRSMGVISSLTAAGKTKDEMIMELRSEVKKLQVQEQERRQDIDNPVEKLRAANQHVKTLTEKNTQLRQQLDELQMFQVLRERLERRVVEAQEQMEEQKRAHKKEMDDLEHAFLAARERLQEESKAKVLETRDMMKRSRASRLHRDETVLRDENSRMTQELQFHAETSNALQAQNDELRAKLDRLTRELQLCEGKDQEYAKRGVLREKLVRELSAKNKALEQNVSQILRNTDVERQTIQLEHAHQLEVLQRRLAQAETSLKQKVAEMKNVKRLARTILSQRNEVETFFLEALEQVKKEIKAKRERDMLHAKETYNKHMRSLINNKGLNLPPLPDDEEQPPPKGARVRLADLGPSHREKVLRLLFAKMNNRKVARNAAPPHSFDVQASQYLQAQSKAPANRQQAPALTGPTQPHNGSSTFLTS